MDSGVDMIGPEEEGEDARVTDFKGRHFTGEVILWAVCWYLMVPVSYRNLELAPTNELPLRYEFCDEARTLVSEGGGSTPCRPREPGAVFLDNNLNSL